MNPFDEYAVLDAQIKALTAQKEALRPALLEEVLRLPEKKYDSDLGKFGITHTSKWTYPDKVLKMEEAYKTAMERAKSTGEATCEVVETLRFTPVKL